jgi:hypothetical protein
LSVAFSNLKNPDGFISGRSQCRARLEAKASAVSRADHDTAGRCGITFELGAGERLAVVGTAIFEGVQFTIQASDGDVITVDFHFETRLRSELFD